MSNCSSNPGALVVNSITTPFEGFGIEISFVFDFSCLKSGWWSDSVALNEADEISKTSEMDSKGIWAPSSLLTLVNSASDGTSISANWASSVNVTVCCHFTSLPISIGRWSRIKSEMLSVDCNLEATEESELVVISTLENSSKSSAAGIFVDSGGGVSVGSGFSSVPGPVVVSGVISISVSFVSFDSVSVGSGSSPVSSSVGVSELVVTLASENSEIFSDVSVVESEVVITWADSE